MDISKSLKALVVVDVTHDLEPLSITLQIVKDKVLSLSSDVGDSTGQRNSLFEELAFLAGWVILRDELRNGDADVELMRVRVSLRGLFQFVNHV